MTNRGDLITTDTISIKNYKNDGITTYESFLDWWENGFIELRIGISERFFKRIFEFYRFPTEEDFKLLMSTTALDLQFVGNLLLSYKDTDDLLPKLKTRYKNFKSDAKFIKIKRKVDKNPLYCGERYLDIKRKKGIPKKYYSPEIFKEFDEHYQKK